MGSPSVCVCVWGGGVTDRLVLSITNSSDEQVDQLRAQDKAVEGEWSEALLHGPLLTGRLVWIQVGVGSMSAHVGHNK